MGAVKPGEPRGKLFFGLLSSSGELLEAVRQRLAMDFSPVVAATRLIPFDQTDYYRGEMGDRLHRQWVAMDLPILLRELVSIKHFTNSLELVYAGEGRRRINIDPGYVVMSKVVLATTKDYDHRLYIARGIFEEVTLSYKKRGGFEPMPWTYPDYRTEAAREFFSEARQLFARQLKDEAPGR